MFVSLHAQAANLSVIFKIGSAKTVMHQDYSLMEHVRLMTDAAARRLQSNFSRSLNRSGFLDLYIHSDSKQWVGRQITDLIYICLDQWRARRTPGYTSYFPDLHLSAKDLQAAEANLKRKDRVLYEALKGLYTIDADNINHISRLHAFTKRLQSPHPEFRLVQTLIRITTRASKSGLGRRRLLNVLKNEISPLVQEGYAPAFYLQGFIEIHIGNAEAARLMFIKSYYENYAPEESAVIAGLLSRSLGDIPAAVHWLSVAVLKNPKAHYLNALIFYDQKALGRFKECVETARKIVDAWHHFHPQAVVDSMAAISLYYFQKGMDQRMQGNPSSIDSPAGAGPRAAEAKAGDFFPPPPRGTRWSPPGGLLPPNPAKLPRAGART